MYGTSSHLAAECKCDMDSPGPSDIEVLYEQLTELADFQTHGTTDANTATMTEYQPQPVE